MLRTWTVMLGCAQPCSTTVVPGASTTSLLLLVAPNTASHLRKVDVSCSHTGGKVCARTHSHAHSMRTPGRGVCRLGRRQQEVA
jgi:hypothetical protein